MILKAEYHHVLLHNFYYYDIWCIRYIVTIPTQIAADWVNLIFVLFA